MQIEQITYQLTWQIRHEVMWPHEPPEYVRLPEDPDGMHYGVFDHNRLCTVVSVFKDGQSAQFRKLATRVDFQQKGYATALLTYLWDDLPTFGIRHVWCNARLEKIGFYVKMGMTVTEEAFTENGRDYIIMEKMLTMENQSSISRF